jgi:hypothetical protein
VVLGSHFLKPCFQDWAVSRIQSLYLGRIEIDTNYVVTFMG